LNVGAGAGVAAHEEGFEFGFAEAEQGNEVNAAGAREANVRDNEVSFRMSIPDAIGFNGVGREKKFIAILFEN
jgi:hypothetical protein